MEIKVHVIKYPDRPRLMMRYRCPDSGKQIARSTGTTKQREAERAAAKWEAELREGRYNKPSKMTWQEFRDQFDRDVLSGLRETTAMAYESTFNVFERKCKPGKLSQLTTQKVTAFVTMCREDGLTPATIARHLRTLKLASRWAREQGMMHNIPEFKMPSEAKGAKGRALSLEEFERMLAKAGPLDFYLRGLWSSGLRLAESLQLRWDDAPGALVADFTGRRPMLRIPAESEKGNCHRLLPMAPEFAELLETVPEDERRGHVFRFPADCPRTVHAVCQRVVSIGKAAGVVIKPRNKVDADGKPINQCASAHDLRRSFGFRWSRKVMPAVLKELMRHASIETTMTFYVGQNAEATADELWECHQRETQPESEAAVG